MVLCQQRFLGCFLPQTPLRLSQVRLAGHYRFWRGGYRCFRSITQCSDRSLCGVLNVTFRLGFKLFTCVLHKIEQILHAWNALQLRLLEFIADELQCPLSAVDPRQIRFRKGDLLTQNIAGPGVRPVQYFSSRRTALRPELIPAVVFHCCQQFRIFAKTASPWGRVRANAWVKFEYDAGEVSHPTPSMTSARCVLMTR